MYCSEKKNNCHQWTLWVLKKAKEYNKTDDFKEDMKQRAHIEPKQGEMKNIMGCRGQNIGDFRKWIYKQQ